MVKAGFRQLSDKVQYMRHELNLPEMRSSHNRTVGEHTHELFHWNRGVRTHRKMLPRHYDTVEKENKIVRLRGEITYKAQEVRGGECTLGIQPVVRPKGALY